jgi:hypothetical protein
MPRTVCSWKAASVLSAPPSPAIQKSSVMTVQNDAQSLIQVPGAPVAAQHRCLPARLLLKPWTDVVRFGQASQTPITQGTLLAAP